MKKMFNEGNQIHNFMSSSGSGSGINYGSGSGSDFLTSYSSGSGSGSKSQKVTVPTVPVPVPVPVPQHWKKVMVVKISIQRPERKEKQYFAELYRTVRYLNKARKKTFVMLESAAISTQ
jgi:hypothetical protein